MKRHSLLYHWFQCHSYFSYPYKHDELKQYDSNHQTIFYRWRLDSLVTSCLSWGFFAFRNILERDGSWSIAFVSCPGERCQETVSCWKLAKKYLLTTEAQFQAGVPPCPHKSHANPSLYCPPQQTSRFGYFQNTDSNLKPSTSGKHSLDSDSL